MVDVERRKRLAFHLRQLATGLITNDDFESAVAEEITDGWLPEQYYRSKAASSDDHIMKPMLEVCWGLYDDTRNHQLTGADKLSPNALKIISRCILFLRSDKEYEWRYFDNKANISLIDLALELLTFGYHLKRKRKYQEQLFLVWQKLGDYDVWPFMSHADYTVHLRSPSFFKSCALVGIHKTKPVTGT